MHDLDPQPTPFANESRDLDALRRLVLAHRHGVYRYGLQVCRTTEDAEDAVQETLWAATRAIKAFRGTASSVVHWMFTIVRRECLRLIEQRRVASLGLDHGQSELAADLPDAAEAVAEKQRAELLAYALMDLDPLHREVLLLRDIQELSAPEAAAQLGISVAALKSRLHRARVNLRERVLLRCAPPLTRTRSTRGAD